jgi:hypothetical protein
MVVPVAVPGITNSIRSMAPFRLLRFFLFTFVFWIQLSIMRDRARLDPNGVRLRGHQPPATSQKSGPALKMVRSHQDEPPVRTSRVLVAPTDIFGVAYA